MREQTDAAITESLESRMHPLQFEIIELLKHPYIELLAPEIIAEFEDDAIIFKQPPVIMFPEISSNGLHTHESFDPIIVECREQLINPS
jgi:hypothetical protein